LAGKSAEPEVVARRYKSPSQATSFDPIPVSLTLLELGVSYLRNVKFGFLAINVVLCNLGVA